MEVSERDDLLEAVVGDGDERIHLVTQQLRGLLCVESTTSALPGERLGHDADGQGAHVARDLGDDGCGPGTSPTTHAGSDEDEVGVTQDVGDLLGVFLCGTLADAGIAASAEAARDLVADADLVGGVRLQERLGVGVDGDELHAHQLRADHAVDGVAAAAADPDDADEGEVL